MRIALRCLGVAVVVGLALVAPPAVEPMPSASAFGGMAGAPAATPVPAGMVEDQRTAVAAVDGFWRRHFGELFGKPYSSPRVAGAYQGRTGPSCAGRAPLPFNAFYCRSADFLAWDQDLMSAGYSKVGDAWVYLIISHEWGHAIQARVGRALVSQSIELQADCLAGATLQGATRDGLLSLEPGDDEELASALAAAADNFPWTNRRDHGDAQQRIGAFNTGAQGGVKVCS